MSTLFDQIGGSGAVDAAVDLFYRKVLSDDRVSRFFDDVDMDRQAAKQKAFLTMVFGGPNSYSGLDMRRGHTHLIERGMDDSHVDVVVELLDQTLAELGVPAAQIRQVAAIAESVRNDVLDRPAGSGRSVKPGSSHTPKAGSGCGGAGSCPCGKKCASNVA